MSKQLILCLAVSVCLSSNAVYGASGESWEVTSKTDMPGMPVTMGETTVTICIQKGEEKDPAQFMKQAGDCEVTDVKTVGSKTSWNMRCDRDGDMMTGKGEVTHRTDSYKGVSKLSGTSGGRAVSMTTNYQGRRVGTLCDTSDAPVVAVKGMESLNEVMGLASKQMASAMAEQCEVSNYRAAELVSNRYFGPTAACPGKEKFACKVISKSVAKDTDVYLKLVRHDDTSDTSIAKACAIDMETTTRSICKIVDSSNYRELAEYCPAEAKTFQSEQTPPPGSDSGIADIPANSVIDSARKLKSLFGF